MSRVLILSATTGYQLRAFGEAAEQLGVDLVYGTDRCHMIEDPWRDGAVPIRFEDEEASLAAIVGRARAQPIDGVLALGDRPAMIAARVAERLGLPGHPPHAAAAAHNKLMARDRFRAAGLLTPWFFSVPMVEPSLALADARYPCVVKPLALSASRGVIRADNEQELVAALFRLRALLQSPDVRREKHAAHERAIVEGFIEGAEFAVEGLLDRGTLHALAVFDKPDPLDGPFFEETIYVTPSRAGAAIESAIVEAVRRAAAALGLWHGPIHAECRANGRGVYILEVAARPIGGLCARALRFRRDAAPSLLSLEEILLRHALGEPGRQWSREQDAAGVMMIPIPRRGVFRGVEGIDSARRVPGIDDLRITAKPDQLLLPLPEGASYLGFIFSRGPTAASAERALREAHAALTFTIDPEVRVLQSRHG